VYIYIYIYIYSDDVIVIYQPGQVCLYRIKLCGFSIYLLVIIKIKDIIAQ